MEPKRITTRHNQCDICAYHESGHILFAYLCGYTCKEAQLVDEANEEGFSSFSIIDYGNDSQYASRFIATEELDYFMNLNDEEKGEAVAVGRKIARIYMGGSTAATVFQKGGDTGLAIPFQMDYTDLERIEFIASVLQVLGMPPEDDFLENSMSEALYTLSNINVWETVKDLSERLLKFNPLTKGDIEECLEEHGILYAAESNMDEHLQLQKFKV